MIFRFFTASLLLAAAVAVRAADEAPVQPTARQMLKARLAEETKAQAPASKTTSSGGQPASTASNATASTEKTEKNPIVATGPGVPAETPTTKPKPTSNEPATVMPKVEVKKGRITVLDQQLAKQEQDIAREKKNTKPTELDKALNDSKIAKPLAIFGGESTQVRQHVANERVSLMQDEKDLIEAIAHASTPAEKAELKKQLQALRAERRELEKALR